MLLSNDDLNAGVSHGELGSPALHEHTNIYSEEALMPKHLNPHLLEVSILDQFYSFLCILQVHSLAHTGLRMGCGQANQSFQCPGCNW